MQSDLELLYGSDAAPSLARRIADLGSAWRPRIAAGDTSYSEADALLITYADTLRSAGRPPLETLREFLEANTDGHFRYLHLLPFYPWTDDDGFSVVDFHSVDPDVGSWSEVEALGESFQLCFDAVVNHVSKSSRYVEGHLAGDPAFANFCIEQSEAFDAAMVTRPRTSPLFHEYDGADGPVKLWTTFSEDQVDLNFANPEVLLAILEVLLFYASKGAAMIRLDAIPFMWKESGTTCVHRPETHAFIRIVRALFDKVAPRVLLLSETNVPHAENITYFGNQGDEAQMIYNFSLAPLILYGIASGDAAPLTEWAKGLQPIGERCTFLNITSTHDGIGMRPTEGILDEAQRQVLADLALAHGGLVSYRSNPDGSESPYELNLSFYDAVNNPNDPDLGETTQVERFLLSQPSRWR